MKGNAAEVIVVGSGPSGGFAAYELARAGVRVLLTEAGDRADLARLVTHALPFQRGHSTASPFYTNDLGDVTHKGADEVGIDRIRVLGGRSLHWNAVCLRFSADDFRERSVQGIEVDWPLGYDELEPFYSEAERTIGVIGTREGVPTLPDGQYIAPPPPLRCAERLAERACTKLGVRMIPTRKALALKPRVGRGACHYCGHCMSGCHVNAIFTTPNTLFPRVLATGKLTIRTNALARAVLTDARGRARGVSIVDRTTGREEELSAQAVVLACGAVETPRLLLNSTSARFPDGLGNDSGLVGRYLCGHSKGDFYGYLAALEGTEMVNNDGALDHSIIPRWRRPSAKYPGGFQIQTQFAGYDYPHHARHVPGFGAAWKARVRRLAPAMLQMGGFGKVQAREKNRVGVDPARKDRFGIPLPVVDFSFCEEDRALYADMMAAIAEIHHEAGAVLTFKDERIGGFASHEAGTCRMGDDPATSVTNRFGQLHQVPNVMIADGSVFPTFPEKNPTLTLMALSMRAARHLVQEKRHRAF